MFTINDFGQNERVVKNLKTVKEFGGTQLRLYDNLTGIYCRLLPQSDRTYTLAESGISPTGFMGEFYGFADEIGVKKPRFFYRTIRKQIDGMSLGPEDIEFLLNGGFLQTIAARCPECTTVNGFEDMLSAEKLARKIEDSGNIVYDKFIGEINKKLESTTISEQDRQLLIGLQHVYETDMFRTIKNGNKIMQEEQRIFDETTHSAEDIIDDIQQIGRKGLKEDALGQIVDARGIELKMSDYGFDENGLMFNEYGMEQIESMYEAFKDDFDENGLPLPNEEYEYAGTQLAEIIYNYTRYLKDKAQSEKKENDQTK